MADKTRQVSVDGEFFGPGEEDTNAYEPMGETELRKALGRLASDEDGTETITVKTDAGSVQITANPGGGGFSAVGNPGVQGGWADADALLKAII